MNKFSKFNLVKFFGQLPDVSIEPQSIFVYLTRVDLFQLAEEQGFEPWMPLGMLVFKTSAFNRSATPPVVQYNVACSSRPGGRAIYSITRILLRWVYV